MPSVKDLLAGAGVSPWLTPGGQRPQLQGGETLANLLTLDEGGSLEQSSASAMVSLDFPFCVGENQFLWQERLPSTLRRPGEGEGQGGPAAALS